MNAAESAHMLEQLRQAWPDDELKSAEKIECRKLFARFEQATVAIVISDLLASEQPRPGLADLSRMLRVYANEVPKDPMPQPPKPRRPWVCDLDEAPEMDPNWRERLAEIRASLKAAK